MVNQKVGWGWKLDLADAGVNEKAFRSSFATVFLQLNAEIGGMSRIFLWLPEGWFCRVIQRDWRVVFADQGVR